ncbi:hypothetical protein [Halalkalicoccus subterraneus]|uniref:hypothetical protein n=1 Tax=Halalkalicoccus subterraneus TaxID=2675002 RepID=UPI000EFCC0C4|nr:hypothetical protein [Halalkalicoccus subterraneus]
MSAPDSLDDVKELLEAGWEIHWDGRTGADYPPNYRIVEFEKPDGMADYTPVKQLHLLAKDYEDVEKLREEGDGTAAEGDEDDETDESNDENGE